MFEMRKIQLVMLGLTGLLISSCGGGSSSKNDEVEYLAVQESRNGNWEFVDRNGKIKYSDEFKEMPSAVVNGYFSVKEGEGYSLYKAGDKPELVKDCDELFSVGYMSEGLIPVSKPDHHIIVVDGNGKTAFTIEPINGEEVVQSELAFHEGMLAVQTESGKWGYIDTKGNVVVKPQYTQYSSFSDGKACVLNEKDDKKQYLVINKKGETVFKIHDGYSIISSKFSNGMMVVKDNNDHCVFLDEKGEVKYKCPSKVESVEDYNSKYFIFKSEGDYGVMDFDGEAIVRAKYDNVSFLDDSHFICSTKDKAAVLDKSGDEKNKVEDYRKVDNVHGFILGVDKTFLLLDKELKPLKDAEFNDYTSNLSLCGSVRSDYTNIDGVINAVTSMITAKGVGKYVIGENPSAHFSEPENYKYKNKIELEDLSKNGFKYNVNCTAYFTHNLVNSTYSNGWIYSWNPDAILGMIQFSAYTPCNWDATKNAKVIDAIKAKGYTVDDDNLDNSGLKITMLKNDNLKIYVVYREKESRELYVQIYKKEFD